MVPMNLSSLHSASSQGKLPYFPKQFSSDSSLSANRWEAEDRKKDSLRLAPRGGEKKINLSSEIPQISARDNQQLSFSSGGGEGGGGGRDGGNQRDFLVLPMFQMPELSSTSLFCPVLFCYNWFYLLIFLIAYQF